MLQALPHIYDKYTNIHIDIHIYNNVAGGAPLPPTVPLCKDPVQPQQD